MAHRHDARILWERGDQPFTDRKYSRVHSWHFDGGAVVKGSPSPSIVREPLSDPAGVDPEEAFVASIASCHMLFFLDLASREGYRVDRYCDDAVGHMTRNEAGRHFISRVELRPDIAFSGDNVPDAGAIEALHHKSHDLCFIANSVLAEVVVLPPED